MSRSPRRTAAAVRTSYTREPMIAACRGVSRGGDLGLDRCTAAQSSLRTLLALHMFNAGPISALSGESVVSILTHYELTISPSMDGLLFITNAPDNILSYMLSTKGQLGVPGLSLDRADWQGRTYWLTHLPSLARMAVTSRPWGAGHEVAYVAASDLACPREWCSTENPVTAREAAVLAETPLPPPALATMINGILVRLNARDPNGRWDMGGWYSDPLRRSERPVTTGMNRRLIGRGNRWRLQWAGYPFQADVANMLTDDHIGIAGIAARSLPDGGYDLSLNGDVLKIQAWE
jgi:hypothetical protein